MGVLFALLAALSWGASNVLIRASLQGLLPTTATLVSLVAGTLFVLALALPLQGPGAMAFPAGVAGWLVLTGFLQYSLGRLMNFSSVGLAGVNRATAVVGTAPIFASLFAILLTGERFTPPLFLGTLAVSAGIALMVMER